MRGECDPPCSSWDIINDRSSFRVAQPLTVLWIPACARASSRRNRGGCGLGNGMMFFSASCSNTQPATNWFIAVEIVSSTVMPYPSASARCECSKFLQCFLIKFVYREAGQPEFHDIGGRFHGFGSKDKAPRAQENSFCEIASLQLRYHWICRSTLPLSPGRCPEMKHHWPKSGAWRP